MGLIYIFFTLFIYVGLLLWNIKYALCLYSKTNEVHQLFGVTLYMFRTIFPSIIRSLRLYIQHQVYLVRQTGPAVCLLASRLQDLFDVHLMLYVQSSTVDDGRKDGPKHVERYSKIS